MRFLCRHIVTHLYGWRNSAYVKLLLGKILILLANLPESPQRRSSETKYQDTAAKTPIETALIAWLACARTGKVISLGLVANKNWAHPVPTVTSLAIWVIYVTRSVIERCLHWLRSQLVNRVHFCWTVGMLGNGEWL